MAQANPGQTLNGATAAGAGTGIDFLGASSGVAVPTAVSMVVVVTSWSSSYNSAQVASYPYVTAGLEVSLDGTSYTRISSCLIGGNGVFRGIASFPCRYARVTIDTLDSRISAVTFNAWVAGGQ